MRGCGEVVSDDLCLKRTAKPELEKHERNEHKTRKNHKLDTNNNTGVHFDSASILSFLSEVLSICILCLQTQHSISMNTNDYKQLAQGPDHDLSLETEQEEQPNEHGHVAERTSSSSTDSTNPANGQSDPSTTTNVDLITTTATNYGTVLSLEMDVGEPLVVDTMMNRFCRTLFGKRRTLLVGCAAVLLGIVMLSLTVMKFNRHNVADDSPSEQLISPEPVRSDPVVPDPVDSDPVGPDPVDSDPVDSDPVDSDPVDSKLAQLVQSRLASISFDSPTSPESKALDWMVNVDGFDYKAVSDDRLVQRFAVVAMVFSLGLDRKSGMLTSESVCNWRREGSHTSPCNNDGVVNGIIYSDTYERNDCFLPASIGLLTGLTTLDFSHNECNGTIPSEIGLLTGLTYLDLWDGRLTGTIPTEIGLLTGLTTLHLREGSLTGTIPTGIGLLIGLTYLDLSAGSLTGTIPTEIGLLSGLTTLGLSEVSLTGSIPTEIGLLTGLTYLELSEGNLTGTIPTEIALLTSLFSLILGIYDLGETIPTEIGLLTGLAWLYLGHNRLTGTIPTEIGLLTGLTRLDLDNNTITGSIPTKIGMLTSLFDLYLDTNDLTGSIPTEIGLLTSLRALYLYNTTLTGSIPTRICGRPHTFFLIDCNKVACSCCIDKDWNPCPAN